LDRPDATNGWVLGDKVECGALGRGGVVTGIGVAANERLEDWRGALRGGEWEQGESHLEKILMHLCFRQTMMFNMITGWNIIF
jgi:hypothetical protein